MAKTPKKAAKKQATSMRMRRKQGKKQQMSGFWPLLFVAIIVLAFFSPAAAGLAVVGLVPSIVLSVTGRGSYKSERLQCVGFMNAAGVAPFVMQVVSRPNEFATVIGNPINMAIMFGSAAVGYALIYVGPMVAAMILQTMAQERLKTIAQQRQTLIDAWGHELIGDNKEPAQGEPDWAQKKR